mgnify:CR=1 FL=1
MIKAIFMDYTGTILQEDSWQMKEVQHRVCAASTCRDEDDLLARFHTHLKAWEEQSVGETYRDADEVVTCTFRSLGEEIAMTDEELAHLLHSAEEHLFTGNLIRL